jgi:nucleotide-binding universal stress UspA family protein
VEDLHDASGEMPIDRAQERLFQLGLPAHTFCTVDERVETGTPWKEILGVAQATHAELIVIGAHKRGASPRLFPVSTANEIVRRASCPVLVVPEKDAAADERPGVATSFASRAQAWAARP